MITRGDAAGVLDLSNVWGQASATHNDQGFALGQAQAGITPAAFAGPAGDRMRTSVSQLHAASNAMAEAYNRVGSFLPRVGDAIETLQHAERQEIQAQEHVDVAQRQLIAAESEERAAAAAVAAAEAAAAVASVVHALGVHTGAAGPTPSQSAALAAAQQAVARARAVLERDRASLQRAQHLLIEADQKYRQVMTRFAGICRTEIAAASRALPAISGPQVAGLRADLRSLSEIPALVGSAWASSLLPQLTGDVHHENGAAVAGLYNYLASYNPLKHLRGASPGQSFGACYVGGARYLAGGYVVGPFGRRYPLVIPAVPDGHGGYYNANANGDTNPFSSILALGGADPGWYPLATYQGTGPIFGHSSTAGLLAAGALVGATGGTVPTISAASPGDYQGLALDDGLPAWLGSSPRMGSARSGIAGKPTLPPGPDGRDLNSPTTPGEGLAGGGMFGINTVVQAAHATQVNNAGYGAYRVVFDQNVDGQIRARLTAYQMANNGSTRVIVPEGVLLDAHAQPIRADIFRYKPSPVMPYEPPQDNVRVLDHFHSQSSWDEFWSGSDAPVPSYFGGH